MGDEYEQKIRDLQRFYVDFLDDSDDQGIYSKLVRYCLKAHLEGKYRILFKLSYA